MKIVLSPVTCLTLEQQLGLQREDVEMIMSHPSGMVEVHVKHELTTEQKSKLEQALGLKISEISE